MDHLLLFGQIQKGPDPAAAGGMLAGLGFGIICLWAVVALVGLGLLIWYAITAYNAISACSEKNRAMAPGLVFLVFLLFVPGIGFIALLAMYVVNAIMVANSLEKEFADRGLRPDGDFGKLIGILMIIPCVGFVCLFLWIFKIRGYTAQLAGSSGGRSKRRNDDDDDDDR